MSALSGCLGGCNPLTGVLSEREHVQFERSEGEYLLAIQNDLAESRAVEVTVTDATGVTEAETLSVGPNETASVEGLFETGTEPYTVSVSTNGETTERTLEPSESPENRFEYTISPAGIGFQEGHRPEPGIVIGNELDERVDVRVAVDSCSNGSHVYDVVTVPPDETSSFRGVFADEGKYSVTVRANGRKGRITHRNSRTNTVGITVADSELDMYQGER